MGQGVLDEGLQKGGGPFQVITPLGPKIILPNKYADEVRSNPHLSFARQISKEFLSHLSGYESFHTLFGSVLVETIKSKLTQSLNYIIGDLSDETAAALQERLGESQEWRTINVSQESLELVARLSTLVFIGPELPRNREWLNIVGSYSINVMIAVHKLRLCPAFLRRIANCRTSKRQACRKAIRDARRLIDPVVAKRREERRSQSKDGKLPKSTDTIGWMDDVAKGKSYDFPLHQLFLSGAAIHTTSNFLGTAILDICSYPEYVEPLRAEIRVAIRENGWTKAALQKLKLMDSFLKESQRLSPASIDAKLELSDGTILPKGAPISVATDRMRDPTVYADPQKFDSNRFFKKRQIPSQENN
ncbi:hypothetical protein SLS56_011413 [Neofusicoccum ribis]|uniref:Cytochrome P450 n=1 Tax=Neofusicoccum ribis TaxID=45134 RepID=A0ABR3SBP7_9PEZI